MCSIEIWVIILTLFGLFSFLSNRLLVSLELLHVHAKIFYPLRLFEYFSFFLYRRFSYAIFQIIFDCKSFFSLEFNFNDFSKAAIAGWNYFNGYVGNVTNRIYGIRSFPAEGAILLNFMFVYFIYHPLPIKLPFIFHSVLRVFIQKTFIYWLFLFFAVLIIFTGSRISILALLVSFVIKIKQDFRWRSSGALISLILFSIIGCGVISYTVFYTDSVLERSINLFSMKNVDLAFRVWEHIDTSHTPLEEYDVPLDDAYDISWWMRIDKWCYALKVFVTHPECYLQGVGPGFAMAALDGGFLRILTEYGIIGCFIFGKLFHLIYRQNMQLKWIVVAFLVNMIFFEAYQAYKPMSFLFLLSGYAYSTSLLKEPIIPLKLSPLPT